VQANGSSIDTLQTRVEKGSSGEGQLEYYSNTQKLFALWKRIQFTQVIKKEGEVDNYSVFVNMTLEAELKSDSEVRINFLNEALEVQMREQKFNF
uniref:Phage tail protein n=1 Tax=Globodera pallida TaxID=36090 RepID=A0A183CT78_GLOPA